MTEWVIQFFRNELDLTEAIDHMDYISSTSVATIYHPWINQVINMTSLSPDKVLHIPITGDASSRGIAKQDAEYTGIEIA